MASQTMVAGQLSPNVGRPYSAMMNRGVLIPVGLLLISIFTTAATGARFIQNFNMGNPPLSTDADLFPMEWIFQHPDKLASGWSFSLALLGILMAHELGHYFACRWHRIRASLPYVLPAPTLSGTAGALIRIKSRIPSRPALMDVGIAGPIAGYIATIPTLIIGLSLSKYIKPTAAPALVRFHAPITMRLIFKALEHFNPALPSFELMVPHPVLVAGWVGLFITSLNLIPAGQLDGGHVLYSISPRLHRYSTNLFTLILFIAGIAPGGWVGWLLWGGFLLIPAMRHPKVPAEPSLQGGRLFLGLVAIAILVLTILPQPFANSSLMDYLQR